MNLRSGRSILIAALIVIPIGCGSPDNSDGGPAPETDAGTTDAGTHTETDAGSTPDAGARLDAGNTIVADAGAPTDAGASWSTDAGYIADAGTAWSTTDAGATVGCGPYTPVSVTVLNYLAWCSVSINGATASSSAQQTTCVADGTVTLDATALGGFVLGDWYGTSGDTGSGDPGTVTGSGQSAQSQATVTASGGEGTTLCVSVCCPGVDGSAPCPTTNQCPSSP